MNNKIPGKYRLLIPGLIGLLLLTAASSALAADQRVLYRQPWYYGFSAASFRDTFEVNSTHTSHTGLLMKVGMNLSRNLAVEMHSGLTFKKTTGETPAGEETGQLSTSSVYVRGNLNFPDYTVYGLAGMTKLRFSESDVSGSITAFDTGPAYGIGIDLFGNNTTAVTFQLIRALDGDNYDTDVFSLGFTYFFDALI